MEIRVLGSVEVSHEGVRIPITGRHQPKILAMLAFETGRMVTVSRLIDVLWEEEPPTTARRQVRNYVAALRRTLAAFGADRIVGQGDGYRLEAANVDLDLMRFEGLMSRARKDVRERRHRDAAEKLDEALGLWRGRAFSGIAGRVIEAAASQLEEARLTATEEWAEAQLSLGRHTLVVRGLRTIVVDNPLRQRLAGQMMLALYRCERVSDALEVYERLRQRLTEELGIDPGRTLRELHGKVLREDSSLDGPPVEDATVVALAEIPVPAQLPADVATFTGREEELNTLDKLLDSGHGVAVVSAVSGGGGVGKTALAVHWGRMKVGRFPDGQLYINLRGFDRGEPVEPLEALSSFLRALGVPAPKVPSAVDEAAAMFRSILERRRVLTVLDNARSADQVRPLLPGGSGSAVVITSRNRLAGLAAIDDAKLIGLDTLRPSESLALLTKIVGAERLHVDLAAARRLAELCGHLPLALRIAAANLSGHPEVDVAAFVAELDSAAQLDLLEIDGDPSSAVASTFELSVAALKADARELFLRLGLIPGGDFLVGLAIQVSGRSEVAAKELLGRLVSAHLLESHVEGRYRFHDLVKVFAKRRATESLGASEIQTIDNLVIEWFDQNQRRLDAEDVPNVISTCEALGDHPNVWRVASALYLAEALGVQQSASLQRCEAALRVAEKNNDKPGQARMLSVLGGIHQSTGEINTAIKLCRQAVTIARGSTDPSTFSVLCNGLGIQLLRNGDCGEAEEWLVESLRLAESIDDVQAIHTRTINLGNAYRVLGRYAEAIDHLDRSIELSSQAQNIYTVLSSRISRASVHIDLGSLDDGWRLVTETLELARQNGSPRQEVISLQYLGRIASGRSDFGRAKALVRESIRVARLHGNPRGEYESTRQWAELESDCDDQDRAMELLHQASVVGAAQLSRVEVAESLRLEGKIRVRMNEHRLAIRKAEKAADLFAAMPYPLRLAQTSSILADAYHGLGDRIQGEHFRRQASATFHDLGVLNPIAAQTKLDASPSDD